MDNPNVKAVKTVKLQRRSTLPGPLHRIRNTVVLQKRNNTTSATVGMNTSPARLHHLQHSKTNPYVGWFRHAPSLSAVAPLPMSTRAVAADALWLRDWLVDASVWHQCKRRRISVKNHCLIRASHENMRLESTLLRIQQVMERRSDVRDFRQDLLFLHKRRGHLRGGGADDDARQRPDYDSTFEQFLQDQYASANESITIKALSRIACWLLDVPLPQPTETDHLKHKEHLRHENCDDSSVVAPSVLSGDDDDAQSDYSYDNYDTVSGSRFRPSTKIPDYIDDLASPHESGERRDFPIGGGLSSQAEAYYALSAVYSRILVESNIDGEMTRRRSDSLDDIDRLDYDITQMDIVRMNRIASRHLDVESIVRLPVLTYPTKKNAEPDKRTITPCIPEDDVPAESLSYQESRDAGNSTLSQGDEMHTTEFSWMFVPPSPNVESLDSFSMEHDNSCSNSIESKSSHDHQQSIGDNDVCVICLEHFTPGDRLRLLPCKHSFHVGCIDRWLSGSHSFEDCYTAGCPTCKARPVVIPPMIPECEQQMQGNHRLSQSEGSIPSWSFARLGHILAESQHF
jgi:Ring finger domain